MSDEATCPRCYGRGWYPKHDDDPMMDGAEVYCEDGCAASDRARERDGAPPRDPNSKTP